ncbi:MAG: sigma-54 dependent transcriptional regulator [Pseudomonadota bacterium]
MSKEILIVDDEAVQRRLLESSVRKFGFEPVLATGGEEALGILARPDDHKIAVVILDLVMPDLDGMGVLSRMRENGINIPVIVQTAQGGIDLVVSSMRAGAFDFAVKPVSPERLHVSIQNALKLGALEGAVKRVKRSASGRLSFDDMIAGSPAMARVIDLGKRAAASNIPILIEGESGVGKEIVARAIHGGSERSGRPLISMNCGAIPEHLVESLLFGHERGAFTGASEKHIGKFQEANGGTLFLDEVGELSLDIQVKLLRAIQEKEIDPIGANKTVKTDFRLISATNKDLIKEVEAGRFREDLYYRLNVLPVRVPPLCDRKEDLADLARYFLVKIGAEEGRSHITGISASAIELLLAYDWPGNIRQLENAVFRAVVMCDGKELTIDDFPQIVAQLPDFEPSLTEEVAPKEALPQSVSSASDERQLDTHSRAVEKLAGISTPFAMVPMMDTDGSVRDLVSVEEDLIRFAIDHHKGRMTKVASSLGIGRSTLYRRLKELGIDPDQERQAAE